jgi:hypothetical protein
MLLPAITKIITIPITAASSIRISASQIFLTPLNAFGNLIFFLPFFFPPPFSAAMEQLLRCTGSCGARHRATPAFSAQISLYYIKR